MNKKTTGILIGLLWCGIVWAGETVKAWQLFFSYKSGQVTYLGAQRTKVPPEYFNVQGNWQADFFDCKDLKVFHADFHDPRPVLHFDGQTADGRMTGGQQIMDNMDAPFSIYLSFSLEIKRADFRRLEYGNPQSALAVERETRLLALKSCEIDLKKRYRDPRRY